MLSNVYSIEYLTNAILKMQKEYVFYLSILCFFSSQISMTNLN